MPESKGRSFNDNLYRTCPDCKGSQKVAIDPSPACTNCRCVATDTPGYIRANATLFELETLRAVGDDRDFLLRMIYDSVTHPSRKQGRLALLYAVHHRTAEIARAFPHSGFEEHPPTQEEIGAKLWTSAQECEGKLTGKQRKKDKKAKANPVPAELADMQKEVGERLDTICRLTQDQHNEIEDAKTEARYAKREAERLQLEVDRLEKEEEGYVEQRDKVEDLMVKLSLLLGGDGEWVHRTPPQPPPESGNLYADVPALAETAGGLIQSLAVERDQLVVLLADLNQCIDTSVHVSPETAAVFGRMREFLLTADVPDVRQRHAKHNSQAVDTE